MGMMVPDLPELGLQELGQMAESLTSADTPHPQPTTAEGKSGYDRAVDGLNRLPRPIMAIGTLVLLVYGVLDPAGFETRMQGLAAIPEPLWWLLGGVLTFYFGAREAHYARNAGK